MSVIPLQKKYSTFMKNVTAQLPYTVLLDTLILVTAKDEFASPVDKWKAHSNPYLSQQSSLPHRAFSIFLFNEKNELLLQKRSADKRTFPLCWTNTCCSHPNMVQLPNLELAEEPVRKALHRALRRELQVDLSQLPFYYKDKIVYKQEGTGEREGYGEFEVDYVYLAKVDSAKFTCRPVASEISELKWVRRQQLQSFVKEVREKEGYFSPWFMKMQESGLLGRWWREVEENRLQNSSGENEKRVLNLI